MDINKLLTDLTKVHTAGHINSAAEVAVNTLQSFSDVTVFENYITAEIGKKFKKSLTLEAHIDQIAMIVTEVFDNGFLRVSPVGGIDSRFLPATPVKIYGKKVLDGVFTSQPPHLKKGDVMPDFDNLYVDTGDKNARDLVSAGDLVFFDFAPAPLLNNRFSAVGLDNRAGCATVIKAFEEISKLNLPLNVKLILTYGEEISLRGAKVAFFAADTDSALVVDVSFGDFADIPEHKTAKLKSGTMIGISPILCRDVYKKLEEIAKDRNIPYTLEVMGGRTGTDADVVSVSKSGVKTGLLSIPLRNMHTPVEIIDIDDVIATADLICEYAKEVSLND